MLESTLVLEQNQELFSDPDFRNSLIIKSKSKKRKDIEKAVRDTRRLKKYHTDIIKASSKILTASSIRCKGLSDLRKDIIKNNNGTALEKKTLLDILDTMEKEHMPMFEVISIHFFLKELMSICFLMVVKILQPASVLKL
ncbi:MAG: hypothetical protein ACRCV0_06935 [Brevinema sp.]